MTRLSKKLVAKISSSTSDKEDDEVFLLDRKISLAVEGFTTSGCELTLRDRSRLSKENALGIY
jgi:hypothetical protein